MAGINRPRRFIAGFVGVIAIAVAAMAGVNAVVDPFWRFDLVNIPGFNAQRPQVSSNARLSKAGVVCRLQPTTVILGTSRVEVGINPAHPAFKGAGERAYNLALAGSGLHELDLTLRHAVHASASLKHVLLGLDFLMFNAHREAVVFGAEVFDFDERRLLVSADDSCRRAFWHDAELYLGTKGLVHSVITVLSQQSEPTERTVSDIGRWIAHYDRNGFRNNFYVLQKVLVPTRGYRSIFGIGQEQAYVQKIWRPAPDRRFCFERSGQPNTFAAFRKMLDFARAASVDLKIFINPIHARLLIAAREGGLWPLYEDWKRGLVDVLAAEARASGKPQFVLWDFSGFNSVTVEHVPAAGDTTTVMRGFWESSHYKSELGDLMIDRMLGHSDPSRAIPDDFGVQLTPHMIDEWIARTRIGMRSYIATEPAEAALAKSAVDGVMAGEEGADCGDDVRALREASAARARGEAAAAEAGFARALTLHEANRRRYAELDVPFREAGFNRLLTQTQTGIDLQPPLRTWEAYQERGIQRSRTGDHRGAAEDFSQAIRIGPINTALYYLRGVAYLNAGEPLAAATDFEKGLQLEPSNPTLAKLLEQARTSAKPNQSR